MRYLYYCNSAYQVLNVLNLHWHRQNDDYEQIENYSADIIIMNAFYGAKRIAEIIKDTAVFNKVMLVEKAEDNAGIFHLFVSLSNIVFPSRYLRKTFNLDKRNLRYDVMTVPKFSNALGAIYQLNRNAKLQLYEDGLASYCLDYDLLLSRSKSYKVFYKMFNYGRNFTNFETLYLSHPDLFTGDCIDKVKKTPAFDKNYLNEIKRLFREFAGKEKEYSKKMLWFSQSMFDDQEVLDVLEQYKDDILFHPHPRYPVKSDMFEVSDPNQIWEIKAMNIPDIENKCLISIHSTAVISPKLLFDYEPYVIFVYKLIPFDYEWDFDGTIMPFIKLYKNPEKVMIPSSIEQLKECIESVLNNIR